MQLHHSDTSGKAAENQKGLVTGGKQLCKGWQRQLADRNATREAGRIQKFMYLEHQLVLKRELLLGSDRSSESVSLREQK